VALLSGGCAIHVSTDHAPLTQLQSQPHISRRQARWLEFLSSFRPNVVYVQGRMNPADILSRPPHVPVAALPDLGQGNGGTYVPLALLLCQQETASAGGCSKLAPKPRPTTAPGTLYMLGVGQLVGRGPPNPLCMIALNNLNRNAIPSDACHPIKK
jgi:hypothetical protein